MHGTTRVGRDRRGAGYKVAWLALAVGLIALPSAAQDEGEPAATGGEPRFAIERIVVEGVRHASADLIVEESLLETGREYTEEELRRAVYRIKRLPFILDTRFSLRKGSERGLYELAIAVEETHLLFFGAEIGGTYDDDAFGDEFFGSATGTAGVRRFVGAHGVAYAAIAGSEAQVGYTHYNLFGRRVFASVDYGRSSDCCEGLVTDWGLDDVGSGGRLEFDEERWSVVVGVPLTANQSLRVAASQFAHESTFRFTGVLGELPLVVRNRVSSRDRLAEARWIFDTTDDPIVPTSGRLASLGVLAARRSDRSVNDNSLFPDETLLRGADEGWGAVTTLAQHWALGPRQAIWVKGQGTYTRVESERRIEPLAAAVDVVRETRLSGGVGWAVDLWSPERARRFGDLRFEAQLTSAWSDRDPEPFDVGREWAGIAISPGVVWRNRWGLFRLSLSAELVEGD